MEKKVSSQTQAKGVALYFPASGKNPSMSFRTSLPTSHTITDTRLFISGGKQADSRVGVNTAKPKTLLDVRGHLHLQSDNRDSAMIYFPSSGGKKSGLHIRASESPSPQSDVAETRFFIGTQGHVGINTVEPEHGLCIHPRSGTTDGESMIISKGNLHLKGGIMDLDKQHMLTLEGENRFQSLDVETGLTVGTSKHYEGKERLVHIRGTRRPTLMVSHKSKTAQFLLQTGPASWTVQGSRKTLDLVSSSKTQEKVYFTEQGHFVIGDKEKPEYGMQIETNQKELTPPNDIYIGKGSLILKGAIVKKSTYKGQEIYWRLHPEGFSNMKDISIAGKAAIGASKTKLNLERVRLYIDKGRSVDLGGFGFLYSTNGQGTVSFNEYVVATGGQHVKKLHDKKAFATSLRLGNDGVVEFEGTAHAGVLKMSKLMKINSPLKTVTFEKFANFGMSGGSGQQFPLRVKGGSDTQKSTIAFGHMDNSMGLVGSTSEFAYIGAKDEKKFICIAHSGGKVGFGTTTPTEELTIKTTESESNIYFTSSKTIGKKASLTMEQGGSTKLSVDAGDLTSGKFEVKEFSKIHFNNDGASAPTVFDRGNPPPNMQKGTEFEPPVTSFQTGNVGLGTEKPDKHLTIIGNHWSQGKMILLNGYASYIPTSELIETAEGTGKETQSNTEAPQGETDVVEAVTLLSRLVRKNKQRLLTQLTSIERMEASLAQMTQ